MVTEISTATRTEVLGAIRILLEALFHIGISKP